MVSSLTLFGSFWSTMAVYLAECHSHTRTFVNFHIIHQNDYMNIISVTLIVTRISWAGLSISKTDFFTHHGLERDRCESIL